LRLLSLFVRIVFPATHYQPLPADQPLSPFTFSSLELAPHAPSSELILKNLTSN